MHTHFAFDGGWLIRAPREEVSARLLDLERYVDWWPQVVAVASLGPDDARVLCRSTLPYTLDLTLHALVRGPEVLEVALGGDLRGTVRFRLTPVPPGTWLVLEQTVEVSGLLGLGARVARPLLAWNHRRMMAGCVAGLRRAVAPDS